MLKLYGWWWIVVFEYGVDSKRVCLWVIQWCNYDYNHPLSLL